MKNLFKKKTPSAVTKPVLNDETLFQEIYSVQDELLKEANRILEKCTQSEERYNEIMQLEKRGFINSIPVAELNQLQSQKRIKRIIERYMQSYPNNKFINDEAVKSICDRYGLLFGNVKDYTAEIPVKNQKEIVNFKFKISDSPLGFQTWEYKLSHIPESFRPVGKKQEEEELQELWVFGTNLKIIAPEKKFDMRGKEKKGHVIQGQLPIVPQQLKDPIVLQPVHHGYLIVSSWGLEAADPLVQNPKHN